MLKSVNSLIQLVIILNQLDPVYSVIIRMFHFCCYNKARLSECNEVQLRRLQKPYNASGDAGNWILLCCIDISSRIISRKATLHSNKTLSGNPAITFCFTCNCILQDCTTPVQNLLQWQNNLQNLLFSRAAVVPMDFALRHFVSYFLMQSVAYK